MTRDQANKWAKEIAALQAGKVVQSRWAPSLHPPFKEWQDDPSPDFCSLCTEFRVKPAEPRRVWIHQCASGERMVVDRDTGCPSCTEFVEVLKP